MVLQNEGYILRGGGEKNRDNRLHFGDLYWGPPRTCHLAICGSFRVSGLRFGEGLGFGVSF